MNKPRFLLETAVTNQNPKLVFGGPFGGFGGGDSVGPAERSPNVGGRGRAGDVCLELYISVTMNRALDDSELIIPII